MPAYSQEVTKTNGAILKTIILIGLPIIIQKRKTYRFTASQKILVRPNTLVPF